MAYHLDPEADQIKIGPGSLWRLPAMRRLIYSGVFTLLIFALGVVSLYGYGAWSELPWPLFDCIYFTLITMSTVGYGELLNGMEQLPGVRAITMLLIVGGMGAMVLFASNITAFFVEGDLGTIFIRRRRMREIAKLKGHVVLCGIGSTGRHVAAEFLASGTPFVAVDLSPERLDRVVAMGKENGWVPPTVLGDATREGVLDAANVAAARGVITCLPTDQDNLFAVMVARESNEHCRILTKVIDANNRKITRAGADGGVSPYHIGGLRLASEMMRPAVVTFLDEMRRETDRNVRIEDVFLPDNSRVSGQTLATSGLDNASSALVLAIRRLDGGYQYTPPADYRLAGGETLVVLGDTHQVHALRAYCGDPVVTVLSENV
jgi:voltage-gated potassium channel